MAEGRQRQPSPVGISRGSRPRALILGAGRGIRGGTPTALVLTDSRHRVLDWVLDSFSTVPEVETVFVGGYRVEEVAEHYPAIRFLYNPDWAETGPVHSLGLAMGGAPETTYVCYSDIVFRSELIRSMDRLEADLVLAVDSQWRTRYEGRSSRDMALAEKARLEGDRLLGIGRRVPTAEADAEFVGLMKLSPGAWEAVRDALRENVFDRGARLPDLIRHLSERGASVAIVDVLGDWAELNAPQDIARFVLGTKAESLERLRPLIRKGRIGRQVSFTHSEWKGDSARWLDRVRDEFEGNPLIVRSSALSEDSWLQSAAGAYQSFLGVPSLDREAVASAVDAVFASYGAPHAEDQVLVQRLLTDVSMSGVIMTRTPTLGAPYFVINFDASSGSTQTVTDGSGVGIRTVYVHRRSDVRDDVPRPLHHLLEAAREIEELVGHDSLDMEFAFTGTDRPHILQIRPIAVSHPDQPVDDDKVAAGLDRARAYLDELQAPSPLILGSTTRLSVMTDWNPAEMIGVKPRRLAFSLYRRLITDEPWAGQRAELGYRDVRPCNLIVDVLGHPYVDVRVDFNSWIPAEIPDPLAARLVDHYLERLAAHPELHDKVEFDVVLTCRAFDFEQQAERLRRDGFGAEEIAHLEAALLVITRRGIARCAGDVVAIQDLESRRERILSRPLPPLERAFLLLEDVRRAGIPLFAHLARHGFVAVAFLRSLRAIGALDDAEVEAFQASVRTIPALMHDEALEVAAGRRTFDDFVQSYGHLRPASYDISSECYADAPERYLRPIVEAAQKGSVLESPETWSDRTRARVEAALTEAGLGIDCEGLLAFMTAAIEGRELGKFQFMKNVNGALEALAEFGEAHGHPRDDVAHVRIEDLLSLRGAAAEEISYALRRMVRRGREEHYVAHAVCLPAQIVDARDLTGFEQVASEPNYITRKKARARVLALDDEANADVDPAGRIVLIPNADPGYDWIFSRGIAGLVTMYGGVNSHMAIRAAEFELPAAIGIGELLFDEVSRADLLDLDCESRKIRVVH
jgi:choline kinase